MGQNLRLINTFGKTFLYASMGSTIIPTAKLCAIASIIIARKVSLWTTYSNTSLINTPIPTCYKVAVCTFKPIIYQSINTGCGIAIYNNITSCPD